MVTRSKFVVSYEVTATLWKVMCEQRGCGIPVDIGYSSKEEAMEALEGYRKREGKARCDEHWIDDTPVNDDVH